MSSIADPIAKLREYRPLLLALETIGWLHMTGKANQEFLEHPDDNYKNWYEEESPNYDFDKLLSWVKDEFNNKLKNAWPKELAIKHFFTKHDKENPGFLGLLQAGHGMASGIEKNISGKTFEHLSQKCPNIWLSNAFGWPKSNLIVDPPPVLTDDGWKALMLKIKNLLENLAKRGNDPSTNNTDAWWQWRDEAIGENGWLRQKFSNTLAETRLPNNDVTLFDQSYVAAALFKSAAAGLILLENDLPWDIINPKKDTQWRLLTVGIGADLYEARAVKIGDWTGTRMVLEDFFLNVRRLIEVDLAIGSLLYKDSSVCVFSIPGEIKIDKDNILKIKTKEFDDDLKKFEKRKAEINVKFKKYDKKMAEFKISLEKLLKRLGEEIDLIANQSLLETPPYWALSEPSRSLICMTAEIRKAREKMAIPIHRMWQIADQDSAVGHVCPVCLVRQNESCSDKQKPCKQCNDRRIHRLKKWQTDNQKVNKNLEEIQDTIWITEVADTNDRLALITMSLDIEHWLDGSRLDSLRTQAILNCLEANPDLINNQNKIDKKKPFESLLDYIKSILATFDKNDPVLCNLNDGYAHENQENDTRSGEEIWQSFFSKIVEDRTKAPKWAELDNDGRASWLIHQLFRKLASPGRIYRFQQQSEGFFKSLLIEFIKKIVKDKNNWRNRRLIIKPAVASSGLWEDRQVYNGRLNDAPLSLLYRQDQNAFITICNLERIMKNDKDKDSLVGMQLELKNDDNRSPFTLQIESVHDVAGELGVYIPLIPLEISPVRFRVLVPLENASECVDLAIKQWQKEFYKVRDRLPLRIGITAFPRKTPFQSVIEATRFMEAEFERNSEAEILTFPGKEHTVDVASESNDKTSTSQSKIPENPDIDPFYQYYRVVENKDKSFPLDFRTPNGQIYRHISNLKNSGDKVYVFPTRIATVFMDDTAVRFEPLKSRSLEEWQAMRNTWQMIEKGSEKVGHTALLGTWSELAERRQAWQDPNGQWFEGGKEAWLDLARALFHERLAACDYYLDCLVQAAANDLLDCTLEWHVNVLKKRIERRKKDE